MLQKFTLLYILISISFSCVPAKKYNELVAREKINSEELAKFKSTSITNEDKAKELSAQLVSIQNDVLNLKEDTVRLNAQYHLIQIQYDRMVLQNL